MSFFSDLGEFVNGFTSGYSLVNTVSEDISLARINDREYKDEFNQPLEGQALDDAKHKDRRETYYRYNDQKALRGDMEDQLTQAQINQTKAGIRSTNAQTAAQKQQNEFNKQTQGERIRALGLGNDQTDAAIRAENAATTASTAQTALIRQQTQAAQEAAAAAQRNADDVHAKNVADIKASNLDIEAENRALDESKREKDTNTIINAIPQFLDSNSAEELYKKLEKAVGEKTLHGIYKNPKEVQIAMQDINRAKKFIDFAFINHGPEGVIHIVNQMLGQKDRLFALGEDENGTLILFRGQGSGKEPAVIKKFPGEHAKENLRSYIKQNVMPGSIAYQQKIVNENKIRIDKDTAAYQKDYQKILDAKGDVTVRQISMLNRAYPLARQIQEKPVNASPPPPSNGLGGNANSGRTDSGQTFQLRGHGL